MNAYDTWDEIDLKISTLLEHSDCISICLIHKCYTSNQNILFIMIEHIENSHLHDGQSDLDAYDASILLKTRKNHSKLDRSQWYAQFPPKSYQS